MVHQRYFTSDIDEAVGVVASAFSGASFRLATPGGAFGYGQEYRGGPGIATVSQHLSADLHATSTETDSVLVGWSEQGSTTYRVGSQEVSGRTGLVWSGRAPLQAGVGYAVNRSILVDRAAFETRARLLLARDDFTLPHGTPLRSAEDLALVRRHGDALNSTFLHDQVVDSPLAWQSVLDLTVATVLTAAGLDSPAEQMPWIPASIRRAVSYIDDNLDQPITLADIAATARMSARGLHAAFRQHLDQTPMQRLRRGRLDHVRADLIAADPAVSTVATIARRWGFTHHGRFAASYHEAFGEFPNSTLRR